MGLYFVKIEISKLRPPSGAVYSWWGAVPRKRKFEGTPQISQYNLKEFAK